MKQNKERISALTIIGLFVTMLVMSTLTIIALADEASGATKTQWYVFYYHDCEDDISYAGVGNLTNQGYRYQIKHTFIEDGVTLGTDVNRPWINPGDHKFVSRPFGDATDVRIKVTRGHYVGETWVNDERMIDDTYDIECMRIVVPKRQYVTSSGPR